MAHGIVETEDAPRAIGAYSQAISAGGFLFTSGQVSLDPSTGAMVGEGDVGAQTRQAMSNLLAVLVAGGCEISDIVKVTIYLADMNDFGLVNEIYAAALEGHRPARSTVEVARLPKDALVEIDAIAQASRAARISPI
jgi:2-iminobutanoate/2-iminopropanoate deaminase